jgi:membrane dipeptidase
MHFHSFFGESKYHSRPVGKMFADGGATLVSWSLGGDVLWFDWRNKYTQHSVPKPGEALGWFRRELARIKAHMAEQGLRAALTPTDVDKALAGEPRVVLSVEGPAFIEQPEHVQIAYDAGIRHLQLIHFIRNPFGDFQTSPPEHNGLTEIGNKVIAECNRLGILVDLAHASPVTIAGALAVSKVPMIFSHGSVTTGKAPHPGLVTWKARQLTLEQAQTITRAGGIVGLWALSLDVGPTTEAYAGRLLQLADWLGDEHVAFGTDINGLAWNFTLSTYAELRRVVEHWQRQGVPEARIRRIASENYARVLKQAMIARDA